MKQFLKYFCVLFLFFFFVPSFIMPDDNFGDFNFDFDLDNVPSKGQSPTPLKTESIKSWVDISPTEEDALLVIADNVRDPIWSRTNSPEGRDPLYLMAGSYRNCSKKNFQMNLFYNHTDDMNPTVGDFLKLTFDTTAQEDAFFAAIVNALKVASRDKDDVAKDLKLLLSMFRNIWVQERKSGFLCKANLLKGPFVLQVDLPLVMVERNLFTSNRDQKLITDLIDQNFGESKGFDKKREFARIRIGVGDTKLKLGIKPIDSSSFSVCLGLAGVIPTAGGLLLDGKFRKPKETYFEDYDFFAALTDNARDMVLYPDLGNNGHFGIGPFLDLKYNLCNKSLNLWGKFFFDSLLPAKEKRLIMSKKTIENPTSIFSTPPPANQEELMEEFKSQYLAPKEYSVTVHPGGVFEATLGADWTIKRWTIGGWYDFYLQQRETFEKLHGTDVNMNTLKVSEACVDRALQHKLAAEVSYKIKIKKSSMDLGVGGDLTLISRTMGKDWTVYGKFGFNF